MGALLGSTGDCVATDETGTMSERRSLAAASAARMAVSAGC